MHELSIALSILERIDEEASRHSGAVRAVHLRVGVLSGVDCEALRFAYQVACAETDLAGTTLEIEQVPLRVRCSACGSEHAPEMQSIVCPRCITPPQEILAGRELELTALEMDA